MSKRDNVLLLEDMQEAAQKIISYTKGIDRDQFFEDEKTADAVVRNFEIIGEAANRIDDEFKHNNPQIEWNKLRGFRNRLIHDYFGIDYDIVWAIVQSDIPELIDRLSDLINKDHRP